MNKTRIFIVDDHEIFRNGLKLLLNNIENVEVVGEASNGKMFLDTFEQSKADIIFMDISMPVMDGIQATKKALEIDPQLKIIALTTFGETEYFNEMIYSGVVGFMLKSSESEGFRVAIEKVSRGDHYFSEEMITKITKHVIKEKKQEIEKKNLPNLTKREYEVLELICKGYSNERIGECLNISKRTVERHKTNLISKTETQNTLNLVIFAFRHSIIKF
jgi:DNA-binding NarL/FixJ family response regulator